jgi:hypothetical protein
VKERPILFNAEMVNAVLSGRKTQTRRIVPEKVLDEYYNYDEHCDAVMPSGISCTRQYEKEFFLDRCKQGEVGDQLWVRETFRITEPSDCGCSDHCNCNFGGPAYRATSPDDEEKWTPSIHMPRCASRIQLEITGVRVERLNDISEEDAAAEGCDKSKSVAARTIGWCETPVRAFNRLWKQIYGADSWNGNPWVWVVEFKKIETPTSQ